MKKAFSKHLIAIFISVALCLAIIVAFTIILSNINKKTAKVLDLKEKLVSYQINKKAFNEEAQKIKNLESRINNLEKNIIKEESVPELLSSLESLAGQNNISFEITSVQNISSETGNKLVLETKSVAPYKDIMKFLELLRKQSFLTNIKTVYLFSEQASSVESQDPRLPAVNKKTAIIPKEPRWQGVVTIEILSVE
ncbi:MAG TPA: hypothetical protein PLQ20_01430 [Candidatus Paceibacterota bacterium]|nr:hypothetical protein [Candidatus Paceibacterota bacterium]